MFDRAELRSEGTITDQKGLSQAREGPFYVDLKRSVPYLKGPISDIRNPVQDLRWFILGLGEPIPSMKGFNLCLRDPKRYKTVHPDVRGTTAGLKEDSVTLWRPSCFGTTLWLAKSKSPARAQFSRSRYRTSRCRPLARGAYWPQGRAMAPVGPLDFVARQASVWIMTFYISATSFVTFVGWTLDSFRVPEEVRLR